ncbi:hypothetical protein ACLIBG_03840 [Virgibacillus sp. W0181]|uniref:hypothetical protein n=1 Tax=Virgibacillus sp. W0181 TaxID=3391581 RepID=UPI003F46417F
MNWFKRMAIYLFVILLLMSIYNDLTKGTPLKSKDFFAEDEVVTPKEIGVVKIQAHHGDTILTLSEKLEQTRTGKINMKDIITDFKTLNPDADPYKLDPGAYYYFPLNKFDSQ